MSVLIVSATRFEIQPFLNHLSANGIQKNKTLETVRINHKNFDCLVTGPGINQTAYKLASLFTTKKYDLCIQAGICGAFDRQLVKGDVVTVVTETFAQLGAEDGAMFMDIFELGLMNSNDFPFENGRLSNNTELHYRCLEKMKRVDAITVETVHGNPDSITRTEKKYHPAIETMEGAPFFYACLMNKLPFIELRSVSNYVEKRNKENWNIALAVQQLNKVLIDLTEEIAA